MTKEFICINCPMGCRLTAQIEGAQVVRVEGNVCAKGVEYARQEAVRPLRVLTSLMFAANRERPFSVKTSAPIPKERMFQCAETIFRTKPRAPLACGDVIIANVCGTGADVVSTQDVD